MSQSIPPFGELIGACERSAIHLETRDVYAIPEEVEPFVAWKAGFRHEPDDRDSWWNEFKQQIADAVARGVVVRRARVVSEPVTDYIRFEYDGTFKSIASGESVRWLPRRLASDLCVPCNDFWVFDERVVRLHHFSGDGKRVAHELSEDPKLAKVCVSAFEAVWERGIDHADYRPA
jgi:hypothetical protein